MTLNLDPDFAAAVKERLRIRFALALASAEEAQNQNQELAKVLTFIPRAAATTTTQLISHAEAENDENISVRFSEEGDRIRIRVETDGFYQIEAISGRRALLRTDDGGAAYEFILDDGACGEFEIESRPEVVRSLIGGWTIFIGTRA